MEKLIEVFMESPEAGFALLKSMIEKYKHMTYEAAGIISGNSSKGEEEYV